MAKGRDLNGDCFDFEQCIQNAARVKKKIDALEGTLRTMIKATTAVATALESVGHSYVGVTEAATVYRKCEGSSALNRNSLGTKGVALLNTAKLFAMDMREMRDGTSLIEYRSAFQQRIIDRLRPLRETSIKTTAAGKEARSALHKYQTNALIVEKKLNKYAKNNKPISESKRYAKQEAERSKSEKIWRAKSLQFAELYDGLLALMEKGAGETMDHFLDINTLVLQHMVDTVREFGPRAIEFNPPVADTLVNAANRAAMGGEPGDSPPTKSSRIVRGGEVTAPESHAPAWAPGRQVEPFANGSNGSSGPENPYTLNCVNMESDHDNQNSPIAAMPHGRQQWPPCAELETATVASYEVPRKGGGTAPL